MVTEGDNIPGAIAQDDSVTALLMKAHQVAQTIADDDGNVDWKQVYDTMKRGIGTRPEDDLKGIISFVEKKGGNYRTPGCSTISRNFTTHSASRASLGQACCARVRAWPGGVFAWRGC